MNDPISRLNAALEGRYHIERELGEGGMATVYLADDIKHERKVALKVLKSELAAVVGAERFLAEIKTTANLQHPNILPLFDSGEADSFLFYVMPYVEGETLRDRLGREKQLPVDEAVRIATDIAEALHAAHEQGVIHRDIKPANILVSRGRPLVADFGIALAVSAAGGGRLTETGLSMGTPYYMSPEQASADREPSAASDVYSLGCVLYEMLVGEPPYVGGSAQAVLAKILTEDARSPTKARSSIPANVDAALRKALEKLPADRFSGAQDFARALADRSFRHGDGADVRTTASGPLNRVTIGTALLAAASAAAITWVASRPAPPPVSRFALEVPEGHAAPATGSNLAISQDGSNIVYVGPSDDASGQLWLRRRDQLDATPIPGTAGPLINPVLSPDGTRVAFLTPGGLKVASLGGAPTLTISTGAMQTGGLAWGTDGNIYVDVAAGLARIPDSGGPRESFTTLDTANAELSHNWPQVLPNGRGVLFTVWHTPITDYDQHDIAVADVETGAHRILLRGVFARYVDAGYIVYVAADGTLLAAPFDQKRMEVTGPSVALAEGVAVGGNGSVALAVSAGGTLVYTKGPSAGTSSGFELVWVDRNGAAAPVDPGWTFASNGTGNAFGWSLSPDGTRVAIQEDTEAGRDIWVKRLPNGPRTRLTFYEGEDRAPRWTPDGERVTFVSDRETDLEVWSRRWDGTGDAERLFDYDGRIPEGFWAPDGEWFVFRTAGLDTQGEQGSRDIAAIRPASDEAPRTLVATQYMEQGASVSPDGRWMAYSSNETGREEVFIRPFPDAAAGKWPVSRVGGFRPRWAHSGRELFFLVSDGPTLTMMVADVETVGGIAVGPPRRLFELAPGYLFSGASDSYDVAPGDERFLMGRFYQGDQAEGTSSLVVVLNFFEELKARVGRD